MRALSASSALDLATKFPNAQVYGVDLLFLPEEHAGHPINIEYIQGDVMKLMASNGDVRLAPGSLDYVFQRLLICGMTDWPNYVKTAVSSVKSGGWIETHELDFHVWENGVEVKHEWPWQQEQIRMAEEVMGLDLRCSQKLEEWMNEAGLVDIKEVSYLAPFGQWNIEAHPESKGIADYFHKWWRELNWAVLIPNLQGTGAPEHVKEMKMQMLQSLNLAEEEQKKAYEIIVCYGRRP
jgi:hypothetical protein